MLASFGKTLEPSMAPPKQTTRSLAGGPFNWCKKIYLYNSYSYHLNKNYRFDG